MNIRIAIVSSFFSAHHPYFILALPLGYYSYVTMMVHIDGVNVGVSDGVNDCVSESANDCVNFGVNDEVLGMM